MNDYIIKQALDELASKDNDVATGLKLVGYPPPRIRPIGFETLFSIIVSQQLSTHAAAAIMGRAKELLPELKPQAVIDLPEGALRKIGLSHRKVEYATGLSEAILNGSFNPEKLEQLDNEAVKNEIIALKGFGPWSAEIYLMFSLQRQDIFPSGDLALLVALQKLKGLNEKPTPQQAQKLIEHWSPWRTTGSLFLWHYYHGAPT
jgi:DNA-3-methyladenine glycosylase II